MALFAAMGAPISVGVAAGLGHLGWALLLLIVTAIPATAAAVRWRRLHGRGSLGPLQVLPLSERQGQVFTGWFLFAFFLLAGTALGALGGGLRDLGDLGADLAQCSGMSPERG